jgi:rsbT co-antagonist protein RsbR
MSEIRDVEPRLEAIENSLAAAAAGIFHEKVPLDENSPLDALSAVEHGVNLMLEDIGKLRERDAERNRQLQQMLELTQAQTRELEQALETIHNQQRSIAELSTPILQLWEDVLAMPIIGVVDTRRSLDIMEKLLTEVSERQSRYVILDITGVEVVDTKTADHFIKVTQAARLLGATCIVSGIRPAVAQTLVEIGVDMSAIETVSTMKDGLRECLRRMGRIRAAAGSPAIA